MTNFISVYLIAASQTPSSHTSMNAYQKAIISLLVQHGAEIVIPDDQLLEVFLREDIWDKSTKLTIIKFPSLEQLKDFWHSEPNAFALILFNLTHPSQWKILAPRPIN